MNKDVTYKVAVPEEEWIVSLKDAIRELLKDPAYNESRIQLVTNDGKYQVGVTRESETKEFRLAEDGQLDNEGNLIRTYDFYADKI